MGKIGFYIFVLIAVFLIVIYYKGFSSDATALGKVGNTAILYLQGRNSAGQITSYPN